MHVKQHFWGLFEQMSCVVKHGLNTESQVCTFQTLSWSCLNLFMYLFIIILSTANSAFFTRIIIINYYSMGFFISLLLPAWIQIVAMCKNIMLVVSLCFLSLFYCTNVFELFIICSRKVNMCLCKQTKKASLAPQSSTKDRTKIKYLLNCRTGAEDLQSFRHC